MPKPKVETSLEEAYANAVENVAKAQDLDEAERWQVIANQNKLALDERTQSKE